MNRRGFLGAAAAAPFAAPAAFREMAATQATQLGVGQYKGRANVPCGAPAIGPGDIARKVLADPKALAAIRSQLFADNRHVSSIDPDLHVLRAMSPMAKITFQRQRQVERAMEDMTATSYANNAWSMLQTFYEKLR